MQNKTETKLVRIRQVKVIDRYFKRYERGAHHDEDRPQNDEINVCFEYTSGEPRRVNGCWLPRIIAFIEDNITDAVKIKFEVRKKAHVRKRMNDDYECVCL